MLETISFYAMKKLFSIITLPSLGGGGEHPSWGQRGKRKGLFKGNLGSNPTPSPVFGYLYQPKIYACQNYIVYINI